MSDKLIRCKKCVMPTTRSSLYFDDEGVCELCRIQERTIDWDSRWRELIMLCSQHKGKKPYDMVIPLSGGKDSHFQVGLFKVRLGMNPLGVMVDNGSWTATGRDNFQNLSERFDIDIVTFTPSVKKMKEKSRAGFFENLWPEKYWDSILYEKPLEIARKFGIQFVAWGEDTGGFSSQETPSALKLLPKRLQETYAPIDAIFTGYFVPWSRLNNARYAKENGFKGLDDTGEWDRLGLQGFEYEQVDTIGYLVNNWFKFVKFGFSSQTELCSDLIRLGAMTREEGLKRVEAYDWQLDPKMLLDFCEYLDITTKQFWETVDKHANKNLVEFTDHWKLKKEYLQ